MAAPFVLAERGTRLAAAGADDLILMAACLPAVFGAVPKIGTELADILNGAQFDPYTLILPMLTGMGAAISLVAIIAWAVVTTLLVHRHGQSIGKRIMGIRIVRKDGSRASLGRIFWLRNVLNGVLGCLGVIGMLYELIIDPVFIFQDSRQCLHDRIAGTIVIKA